MASNDAPGGILRSGLRSPGFKLLVIALLTAIMAVPLFFIEFALTDRQARAGEAAQDIAQGWGGTQTVAGPALLVPYDVTTQQLVDGRLVEATQHFNAVLLPTELTIDTTAKTEKRWRGIFPVPVYRATVAMHAQFDKAALASLAPDNAKMFWDKAFAWILCRTCTGLAGNIGMR